MVLGLPVSVYSFYYYYYTRCFLLDVQLFVLNTTRSSASFFFRLLHFSLKIARQLLINLRTRIIRLTDHARTHRVRLGPLLAATLCAVSPVLIVQPHTHPRLVAQLIRRLALPRRRGSLPKEFPPRTRGFLFHQVPTNLSFRLIMQIQPEGDSGSVNPRFLRKFIVDHALETVHCFIQESHRLFGSSGDDSAAMALSRPAERHSSGVRDICSTLRTV